MSSPDSGAGIERAITARARGSARVRAVTAAIGAASVVATAAVAAGLPGRDARRRRSQQHLYVGELRFGAERVRLADVRQEVVKP